MIPDKMETFIKWNILSDPEQFHFHRFYYKILLKIHSKKTPVYNINIYSKKVHFAHKILVFYK